MAATMSSECSPSKMNGDAAISSSALAELQQEAERRGSQDSSKETRASKRREDKSIEPGVKVPEHILKALSSLTTPEEKLAALCKKYADLLQDHRDLQAGVKQAGKRETILVSERDRLQGEYNKAVLARSKLESLCRELQRHNKVVKDESLQRAREEEEKRKEVTSKFQTTLNEVTTQMKDNQERNASLKTDNDELAQRLKSLVEQYENREEQIQKYFKHKDIESQLIDAKLQQSNLQLLAEKEKNFKEKELLLTQAMESQKKCIVMEDNEQKLRAQVALYTERYNEFQDTLTKSNDMFSSFKAEMQKMTKKIKKLEKETVQWKSRWENSNQMLITMAEEKIASEKELITLQGRLRRLEALSRALQAERKVVPGASEEVERHLKTPPPTPADNQSRVSPVNESGSLDSGDDSSGGGGGGGAEGRDPAPPRSSPAAPSTPGDGESDSSSVTAVVAAHADAPPPSPESGQSRESPDGASKLDDAPLAAAPVAPPPTSESGESGAGPSASQLEGRASPLEPRPDTLGDDGGRQGSAPLPDDSHQGESPDQSTPEEESGQEPPPSTPEEGVVQSAPSPGETPDLALAATQSVDAKVPDSQSDGCTLPPASQSEPSEKPETAQSGECLPTEVNQSET